jgi:hypothetical protein
MLSACTIVAANYLPFARVLADSFLAHHPGSPFTVLLIDDEQRALAPGDERITWWRLADLGLDAAEIHRLAGIYDVTELATAVKPILLQRLLERDAAAVVYLDPDIACYDSIASVAPLAVTHGIVLTPHTTQPFPKDDRQVDGYFVLSAGVYNLGFIAVAPSARPFLDWWWQVTRREALSDVSRQMFTDQRWIDFVPSFFDHAILKDPGYNVAYWNLHARDVTLDGGRYLVNGVPLRFFHFSGYNPRRPDVLSKHQGSKPRIVLQERPVLQQLCDHYATSLSRAGMTAGERPAYGWAHTASGLELTTRMRRLYRDALIAAERGEAAEPPDPFDRTRPQSFVDWLNAPRAPGGLSRFLESIYRDRLDLQIQFPEVEAVESIGAADTARLADWIWRDRDLREPIPIELLPFPAAGTPGVPGPVAKEPIVTSSSQPPARTPIADQSAAVPLESLLPQLDAMNTLQVSGGSGALAGLRAAAQRLLFRIIRPFAFQQAQLQAQMIVALRHVALALRRQEHLHGSLDTRLRELTREVVEMKREVKRLRDRDNGGDGGNGEDRNALHPPRETQ